MKYVTFYTLFIVTFSGCFQVNCETEYIKIRDMKHNMVIKKTYAKDHLSWIIGIDSKNKADTFQYGGFVGLDDIAVPGSKFIKESNSTVFVIENDTCRFMLSWDCKTGGKLDSLVKINNKR